MKTINMQLTTDEIALSEKAVIWIKKNRKQLINHFVPPTEHIPESTPVSIFMAGSPGAGKTEISKWLVGQYEDKPVRIDADEIRVFCDEYSGANAHVFQKAATKGVNILYDYVLGHKLSVILDGTFAYSDAIKNIERSLEKKRKVEIVFVYQDPVTAWGFTKIREIMERRRVSRDVFISAYLKSQAHANEAKERFGEQIELSLLIKNFKNDLEGMHLNITKIDSYLPNRYSKEELEKLII